MDFLINWIVAKLLKDMGGMDSTPPVETVQRYHEGQVH
jgi:hypothetical protein